LAVLKACLNGARPPRDGVPLSPEELARAARAAVDAGATAVHVHPRDTLGRQTLDAQRVNETVRAIKAAVPLIRVGVSTHEGICPVVPERLALVRGWTAPEDGGPDFASVNWHENGAAEVAGVLRSRGIGVEAGIWTPRAASVFVGTQWPWQVERVLVEVFPGRTPGSDGVWAAERVLAALGMQPAPVLVHGEQAWAWPVLRWAQRRGYGVRIGLEDTLVDELGRRAESNAQLVAQARDLSGQATSGWPAPEPQRETWPLRGQPGVTPRDA